MSTVTCPGCGKRGKFPPHFVGKPIKCRQCGMRFTALADALNSPVVPEGPAAPVGLPVPPALVQTPAGKQEEFLEPVVLEEPEADQPTDYGINLAKPADNGIDLEKKPVIGDSTLTTYLSAINAYMAARGDLPRLSSNDPSSSVAKRIGFTTAASALIVLACVIVGAILWPRNANQEKSNAVANDGQGEGVPKPNVGLPDRTIPGKPTQLTPKGLFEKTSPAVVSIEVRDKRGRPISQGSGFLVSADGLIVTNFHVVWKGYSADVVLHDGRKVPVIGSAGNQQPDLTLLKIEGTYSPLQLCGDDVPHVGAQVFTIGTPQGLPNTMSVGVISGPVRMMNGYPYLQTTAAISEGSSGGPLLNEAGEVVGVTTLTHVDGQNLNFAIPASLVRKLVENRRQVIGLATLQEATRPRLVELTETDIVLVKDFRTSNASVFGVSLGMAVDDALESLGDSFSPGEIKLAQEESISIQPFASKASIATFWIKDKKVSSILLSTGMLPYLVGTTKGLFSPDAVNGRSAVLRTFLGEENGSGAELGDGLLFAFKERGIAIHLGKKNGVSVLLHP